MNAKQMRELINALGAASEMVLIFYRSLVKAGANTEEISKLTRIFIKAILFNDSNSDSVKDEN